MKDVHVRMMGNWITTLWVLQTVRHISIIYFTFFYHCGECTQASTRQVDCGIFASLLNKVHAYDLSSFRVIPKRKKFWLALYDFMIRLDKGISVDKISLEAVSISIHKFAFIIFNQLDSLIYKYENLTGMLYINHIDPISNTIFILMFLYELSPLSNILTNGFLLFM